MKRNRSDNARLHALELLGSVLDYGQNLSDLRTGDREASEPSDSRDRAFSRHLAYGVLRWLSALEWLSRQLLKRPLKSRDRDIHRLILLGLLQLWHGDAAAHAAINESAECARLLGKPWGVAVINAVLRRFQREQAQWLTRLGQRDERHAHPDWLLESLRRDWPSDWEAIVTANNRPGPLWLRVRAGHNTSSQILRLEQEGFACTRHPQVQGAVRVDPAAPVTALPGFSEGLISVQDPAAQLAADLLQLQAGQRVLDACAAPGGKTAHILECSPGVIMTVLDKSEERIALVEQNLRRLGLLAQPGIRLEVADAAEPEAWWDGVSYHRILLDAPCTATGVIRRHPEIKWLRTSRQVAAAIGLQQRLLERLWPLLDTGGILLYATCSVLKDENDRQIEQFSARHPDAEVTAIDGEWGRATGLGRQILPGAHDMDGFYYARLRKI